MFCNLGGVNQARRALVSAAVCSAYCFFVGSAWAATINFSGFSSDGHPVSATAEFTLDAIAETVTVELTNTTAATFDAGELFTGIDFSLGGLTPSLMSKSAIERTIASDGSFADGAIAVDISWSLVSLGGDTYQLNFNPTAKHAIVGPPNGGNYSGANPSVRGNPGHNPFAAEMAVFVLSVPNLQTNTPVALSAFRFGTDLNTAAVPEPASWVLMLLGAVGMSWRRQSR